jgi:hypothetical protein
VAIARNLAKSGGGIDIGEAAKLVTDLIAAAMEPD